MTSMHPGTYRLFVVAAAVPLALSFAACDGWVAPKDLSSLSVVPEHDASGATSTDNITHQGGGDAATGPLEHGAPGDGGPAHTPPPVDNPFSHDKYHQYSPDEGNALSYYRCECSVEPLPPGVFYQHSSFFVCARSPFDANSFKFLRCDLQAQIHMQWCTACFCLPGIPCSVRGL